MLTLEKVQPMAGIVVVEVEDVEERETDSGIVIPGHWEGGGHYIQGAIHKGKVVKVGKGVAQYKNEKDEIKHIDAEEVVEEGDEAVWRMHTQLEIMDIDDKVHMFVHAKNIVGKIIPQPA